MRLYQIIMKVPDDFAPDEMTLSATYSEGDIDICSEGFVGDMKLVECEEAPSDTTEFDSESHYGEVSDLELEDMSYEDDSEKGESESESTEETEDSNNSEGEAVNNNSEE